MGVVLPGLPFPHTQDPGECFDWGGGTGWIANSSTSITRERDPLDETSCVQQGKGRGGEFPFSGPLWPLGWGETVINLLG